MTYFFKIFLLFMFSVSTSFAFAQQAPKPEQIEGAWRGDLNVNGAQLPLIFNIMKASNGSLSATMDSPNQGAKGIPVQTIRLTPDSLYLYVDAISSVYLGKITDLKTIDGQWKQGGQSWPLKISKGNVEPTKWLQEPQKPYPYQEQQIIVENKNAGINLAGTLTLPKGTGKYPAVILITGSGPQDRDETILGHKPFLILADYFTRQGFAVLRLDDRGVGESGGVFDIATTQDFASDIEAALSFLIKHKSINPGKIGLLGHSEGALIASKIAAKKNKIAFVVLMAGSGVSGIELLLAQNEALLQASGVPQDKVQKYLQLRQSQFEAAVRETDVACASERIRMIEQEFKANLTKQEQMELGLTSQSEQAIVVQLSTPWIRYFLAYNPFSDLQKMKMPVLAVTGSKDLQAPAKQNLVAIGKALKAGRNKNYLIKELPNLNHLFQTTTTGLPTEYGQIKEAISPVAIQAIGDWMKRVVNL